MANPILSPLMHWAGKLRFPTLFWLVALLFAADMAIPDFIPGIDELLLGLGTLLLASWKKSRKPKAAVISQQTEPRDVP